MNVPVRWSEDRVSDFEVVFRSEHTFGGRREVRARLVPVYDDEPIIVWENLDDAPHFIIERAREVLRGSK